VGEILLKASENLSVRRAFGAAYEKDGVLIIPVAMVGGGGGGGTARPRNPDQAAGAGNSHVAAAPTASPPSASPAVAGESPPEAGRTDTGGGFGGLVVPTGAYVVKDGQVRWVPAVDATVVIVASLSLVRILTRTWTFWREHRGQR
jgi:uncharacterized spore protein YtfJ